MKRDALTALLGLMMIIRNIPAEVPPPTDVKVSCNNLQVIVGWNYSARPQTNFTVAIMGAKWKHVASTEEHQFDLTDIIWSSEERCMSSNYVTVTATVGGKHSEQAASKSFTFNNVKTAAQICQLDFPPVKLVRKDLEVSLSFRNPFHFYPLKAVKMDLSVNSDTGTKYFSCSVKEETCKYDYTIPFGANYCVTLDGILFEESRVGQVLFKKTKSICAVTEVDPLWVVIGILLGLVALGVIMAVAIIVVKCYSAEPEDEPTALKCEDTGNKKYIIVSPEDTCMVCTEPRNENEPLLSSSEDLQGTVADGGREDESGSQELADTGRLSERSGSDADSADCSEKTEYVSTDLSESEGSAYDCPHVPVDMGQGDMATGYMERHRMEVNAHIQGDVSAETEPSPFVVQNSRESRIGELQKDGRSTGINCNM